MEYYSAIKKNVICRNMEEPRDCHTEWSKSDRKGEILSCCCLVAKSCSSFVTLWTVASQPPPSMRFPKLEYQSRLSFSSPGDLSNRGIEPATPALAGGFFITEPPGNPKIPYDIPCMWNLKRNNPNKLIYKIETHRLREQTYGCQEQEWGERIVREFGMTVHTALFKWITNKNLLHSTGNPSQCYVAAWMGGEVGGEWIHVYVRLSAFAVHLNLSQHC